MIDNERTRAAVHEAGHVLVAFSRGFPVTLAKIDPDGGEGVVGIDGNPTDLDQAWIAHGGPSAEAMVFGRWEPRATPSGQDDLSRALVAAKRAGVFNPALMKDVTEFLEGRRPALEAIAARLAEVGTLRQPELDSLLQKSRP